MNATDEVRLKPAAAMTDSTELREIVDGIYNGQMVASGQENPLSQVDFNGSRKQVPD